MGAERYLFRGAPGSTGGGREALGPPKQEAEAVSEILVGKSAQEYFREVVGEVLTQRRLKIREETEFYLVNLLSQYLQRERLFGGGAGGPAETEPLAFIL